MGWEARFYSLPATVRTSERGQRDRRERRSAPIFETEPPTSPLAPRNFARAGCPTAMDHRIVFIAVGVALVVVIGYVLVMRVFFRESAALDKTIDYSKMKEWKDED